jgi:hypothetical protein
MEPINVLWLMCKESPGPTQTPCKHWVFATDGYDLKIDIPTAMKFARSIADQFPGQTLGHMEGRDLRLRRTFKVFGSRKVEVILTPPAAKVIVDTILDRDVGRAAVAAR